MLKSSLLLAALACTPCYNAVVPGFGTTNPNDNDILVPELWARESLFALTEQVVAPMLMWRTFPGANQLASVGDIVNVGRPRRRTARRKTDGETIQRAPAITDKVQVELNQHFYDSFILHDGEITMGFDELKRLHLKPAIEGIATQVERAALAQLVNFAFKSRVGRLGVAPNHRTLLDARNVMNKQLAPNKRNMILTSDTETELLDLDEYKHANESADGGSALRNAALGRKAGWDFFLSLLQPSVSVEGSGTTATTLTAAATKGDTVISVAATTDFAINSFIVVDGDDTPLRVVAINALDITVSNGLLRDVANGSAVRVILADTVAQPSAAIADGGDGATAGYRYAWHKEITVTDPLLLPEVGQFVTFSNVPNSPVYVVIEVSATGFQVDRPLDVAVANGATINYGPLGQFNFGFAEEAVGFITRPLAQPQQGQGVVSDVVNYEGLNLRVTMGYDMDEQGHVVTIDMLAGFATLYEEFGVVMLG